MNELDPLNPEFEALFSALEKTNPILRNMDIAAVSTRAYIPRKYSGSTPYSPYSPILVSSHSISATQSQIDEYGALTKHLHCNPNIYYSSK